MECASYCNNSPPDDRSCLKFRLEDAKVHQVILHRSKICVSNRKRVLKSQIFPVKNANLRSSGLVGLVAKSSVFKLGNFCNLLSSHLRFWVSFNLLSSQRLIFRLSKNAVTPPAIPVANSVLLYFGCNEQEWEANDILSSCTRSRWSLIYSNKWNKKREWTYEWYFLGLAQYSFWVTVGYQRQHDSSQAKLSIS